MLRRNRQPEEEGDERIALYKKEAENVVNVEIDNTRVLQGISSKDIFRRTIVWFWKD